jgi:hypothetical protein
MDGALPSVIVPCTGWPPATDDGLMVKSEIGGAEVCGSTLSVAVWLDEPAVAVRVAVTCPVTAVVLMVNVILLLPAGTVDNCRRARLSALRRQEVDLAGADKKQAGRYAIYFYGSPQQRH